jgi:hypothetical protein
MANKKTLSGGPITAKDLLDFAVADSDFGFEMQVLRQLRADGFSCSHSGTYVDPVTAKIRQFDIRALKEHGDSLLALAVECKNLRSYNPLLLSAVPRAPSEAFHDLIAWRREHGSCSIRPVSGGASFYKTGEMVGKKTDQVHRRDANKAEFVGNDEVTFEKLNQAVNSSLDLVLESANRRTPPFARAIVPVLVVPTGLLWQVDYGLDGEIALPPRQVSSAALFIDHTWPFPGPYAETLRYRLSHIQVVTSGALAEIAESWLGPEGFFPQ